MVESAAVALMATNKNETSSFMNAARLQAMGALRTVIEQYSGSSVESFQ
jgi:hypothetical protein